MRACIACVHACMCACVCACVLHASAGLGDDKEADKN
jgi:hypothetical protein